MVVNYRLDLDSCLFIVRNWDAYVVFKYSESNAPVTAVAESSVKESEDVAPAVETSEGGAPQANTGENKPDSTVVNGNNGRNAPHQNNRRFNNRRFNNNTGGQQQGFNGPHRNNYRNNSFRRYAFSVIFQRIFIL